MQITPGMPPTIARAKSLPFRACLNEHAKPDFVSLSVEEKSQGLTFKEMLALARPETDRATSSERINPASDALLVNLVDKMPVDVARMGFNAIKRWVVHGDGTPKNLRQAEQDYVIGREAPLDIEPLLESLQAVMKEFPQFAPHIGQEHVWSDDVGFAVGVVPRAELALQGQRPFPTPIFGSKLISALGLGATALVMPTGKEEALKSWVVQQEKGSVELHTLFREAYRLSEGDLYSTLLCAENVLSEGLYLEDQRDHQEVTQRLSHLRSDSAPAGDKFGSWYHLFGAALYRLMRPSWKAGLAIAVENGGSKILEGSDPQEGHINKLGLKLGAGLKRIAEEGLAPEASLRPYVNTREFGWDRRNAALWTTLPS
jgi:hypothetical protein